MYNDVSTFLVNSTSDIVQGKKRRGIPFRRSRSGVLHRTTSQLLPVSSQSHSHTPFHLCLQSTQGSSVQTRALSASHTSSSSYRHHYVTVDQGPVVSRETTPDLTRPRSGASNTSELELQNVTSEPVRSSSFSTLLIWAVASYPAITFYCTYIYAPARWSNFPKNALHGPLSESKASSMHKHINQKRITWQSVYCLYYALSSGG